MKEAASSLSRIPGTCEFILIFSKSSEERRARGNAKGNSVYRTRCLPFDVYKLPTAGTANAKAYALYECVCVCAYLLGAILNIHMFKATWHTARVALLPPRPAKTSTKHAALTFVRLRVRVSRTVWMYEWMTECLNEWVNAKCPFWLVLLVVFWRRMHNSLHGLRLRQIERATLSPPSLPVGPSKWCQNFVYSPEKNICYFNYLNVILQIVFLCSRISKMGEGCLRNGRKWKFTNISNIFISFPINPPSFTIHC